MTCIASSPALALDAPGSFLPFERPALVLDVAATGTDLDVTLQWNGVDPSTLGLAYLRVRSAGGELVAEDVVVPLASGQSLEIATDALIEVTLHGLQYEVSLEDATGNLLSDVMPVRIQLDCAAGGHCLFEAIPGLDTSNAFQISPELADAFEQLNQSQSTDLWRDVLALGRSYQSPLYTHLLELEVVGATSGSAGDGESDCNCLFTTHSEFSGPPARGYGHLILAEASFYQSSQATQGETSIEMNLLCYRPLSQRQGTKLFLPGAQTVVVDEQEVAVCAAPCQPRIRQRLNFAGRSWAAGEPGVVGTAVTDLTYGIDARDALTEKIETEKKTTTPAPGDADRLDVIRRRLGSVGLLTSYSSATIGNLTSADEGFSAAKGEFDLIAQGKLTCLSLEAEALLQSRQHGLPPDAEIELFGGEEDEDDGFDN